MAFSGVMHSPVKSNSQPDLRKLPPSEGPSRTGLHKDSPPKITMRKRRHDDEYTDAFEAFSSQLMSTLNDWKLNMDNALENVNNNVNAVIRNDLSQLTDTTKELKCEISNVRKEYAEIKALVKDLDSKHQKIHDEVDSLKTLVKFNSDQQDDMTKKFNSLGDYSKNLQRVEIELASVKNENRLLRSTMNENEQRDRLLNLELIGITELKGENLLEILLNISRTVGGNLTADDIIHVNRVTPRNKLQGRPRTIIAKLKTRLTRDNFLSHARKRRLTTADINIQGASCPVYVNEHLTGYNKQLLKKSKIAAKEKGYEFVWSKNGRVYVRKNDTTQLIPIAVEEDLKKII